ncbi:MAG TPA: response regulator transcription factor [Opitutaceae bacterium]
MTLAPSVLVVDDTPANVGLLIEALGETGYQVRVAESGRSALKQLEHGLPDLILLDVIMPGLDGFATCAALKANPAWSGIPVLFMTSLNEPDEKVRAFSAGAVDYILKPAYPPEVLARVRAHLEIRRLQRALEEELSLRIDAENQLRQSLDRAVLITDASGAIVFSTRLAEDLLHQHCPDYEAGSLPPSLTRPESPLHARRFAERGRDDLTLLVLEEKVPSAQPAALTVLGLTSRESEVLFWIARGKSNPDIATILGAGLRTIHKHVENIFRKLGCETRAAAAVTALDVMRGGR